MLAIFIVLMCLSLLISAINILRLAFMAHESGQLRLIIPTLIVGIFCAALIANFAIGGYFAYASHDSAMYQEKIADVNEKLTAVEDELLINFDNWMKGHDKEAPDEMTIEAIVDKYPELKRTAWIELLEYNSLKTKQNALNKSAHSISDLILYWPIIK